MKHLKTWLTLSAAVIALGMGCGNAQAQPGPGMMNMDPEQMRQEMQKRIMDYFREQLVVTNDVEWGVIEKRLSKVMQLRMETLSSSMGMMGGMRRGGFRGFLGMSQPGPEAEALHKAIDGNVPAQQLKDAMAKFRDWRKRKQSELVKAQDDLRQVLTVRQEAIMLGAGMLE
jgi:hypothetical protein